MKQKQQDKKEIISKGIATFTISAAFICLKGISKNCVVQMESAKTEQKQEKEAVTIPFAKHRGQVCLNRIETKNWNEVQYWMSLPSFFAKLMRGVIIDFKKKNF